MAITHPLFFNEAPFGKNYSQSRGVLEPFFVFINAEKLCRFELASSAVILAQSKGESNFGKVFLLRDFSPSRELV